MPEKPETRGGAPPGRHGAAGGADRRISARKSTESPLVGAGKQPCEPAASSIYLRLFPSPLWFGTDLHGGVASVVRERSRRNSVISSRMGMATRPSQASYANLRSGKFALLAHCSGVKSLCSYPECSDQLGPKTPTLPVRHQLHQSPLDTRPVRGSSVLLRAASATTWSSTARFKNNGPTVAARLRGGSLCLCGQISLCLA